MNFLNDNKQISFNPTSSRAKNRINEHGEVFKLIRKDRFGGDNAILVTSVDKTWNNNTELWKGWFTDKEIDFESIKVI